MKKAQIIGGKKKKKQKTSGLSLSLSLSLVCHRKQNGSCKNPREEECLKNILSVLKAMNEIKETAFIAPDSHDYRGSAINM